MTIQPIGFSIGDWTPPVRPPGEPMIGRYCRLERLDADRDGQSLFDAYALDSEGRNWTYLPQGPFENYAEFYIWLSDMAKLDDPFFFAIIDGESQTSVGIASYLRITPPAGSIEVGYIHYSPLLQRTPAATEAMYLMMEQAFTLGYRRYEWKCDALNAPSRIAAQRLGLSYEGVFRQATVYKQRNRDTAWYATIDREWPDLKQAFEQWLDPNNFDNDRNQKTRLSTLTAPLLKATG
ncbi:MAG: GNAT family protein [Arenicellales bacterium]|jgi:RimJ/RimL family protein N-acetyltransferase|nr:GNAT family protein [Arenicellales bacterium]|tara:strand:- start:2539 stop:3246 length:708 start_codon:yes stop_codon:yes gene_type:complete